jgi:dihydropyrimidinase
MATVDLVVHGGRVALPGGVAETGIAISGERIVAIGEPDALPPAREYLDVTGKDVLPGVIDAHSHLGFDDWSSLPASSAYGGVTTSIPFIGGAGVEATLGEIVRANREEAERRSVLDVAFHAYLFPRGGAYDRTLLDGIAETAALGVRSYKMFTAYRKRGMLSGDDFLYRAFQRLTAEGCLPMVHAENGDLIDAIEEQLLAEGKTGPEYYHDSRPPEAEAQAIERVASLAQLAQAPVYIVHLSTELGLDLIRGWQQPGQRIWTETCPQYLVLSNGDVLRRGAFAKIAPPLRHEDDIAAMWHGLQEGWISVVASDHSPHDPALKAQGAKNIFYLPDGASVPFGMPGAETLLPVLYSEGVAGRDLPLTWLARVLCENPARIFGLYPRKGVIAPGSDADLTVIDPAKRVTVAATNLHSRTGYSIYEGIQLSGFPVLTLLRGRVLLRDGALQQPEGYGRYLPAGASLPPIQGPVRWSTALTA